MKVCPLCCKKLDKEIFSINYNCDFCGNFKMDFGFLSQLEYFKIRYSQYYPRVVQIIQEYIKKYDGKILFTEDYEEIQDQFELIIIELNDITNTFGLDISSNSRGSDYGD